EARGRVRRGAANGSLWRLAARQGALDAKCLAVVPADARVFTEEAPQLRFPALQVVGDVAREQEIGRRAQLRDAAGGSATQRRRFELEFFDHRKVSGGVEPGTGSEAHER